MILVTVGSQLPFDRLVRAVDAWCASSSRADVFGQIGDPGPHGYRPLHFDWESFVAPKVFNAFVGGAELIIAHAGMGCILAALIRAKPIVIMPRLAALGEHRNDHQCATAARFADRCSIYVAHDVSLLAPTLERALLETAQAPAEAASAYADPRLIASIRRFILTGDSRVWADEQGDRAAADKVSISR